MSLASSLLDLRLELSEFSGVDEQFSSSDRVVILGVAKRVGRDVALDEPELVVLDPGWIHGVRPSRDWKHVA